MTDLATEEDQLQVSIYRYVWERIPRAHFVHFLFRDTRVSTSVTIQAVIGRKPDSLLLPCSASPFAAANIIPDIPARMNFESRVTTATSKRYAIRFSSGRDCSLWQPNVAIYSISVSIADRIDNDNTYVTYKSSPPFLLYQRIERVTLLLLLFPQNFLLLG